MKEKCNHSTQSAIYFDVNLQSWVCRKCNEKIQSEFEFNMNDIINDEKLEAEIESISKAVDAEMKKEEETLKAIDDRFNRTAYSKNLEDIFNTLKEEELREILGDSKEIKKYNKNQLIIYALNNYEKILLKKVKYGDENLYKVLKRYCRNDGESNFKDLSNKDIQYVDYLITSGIIFPTRDESGRHVLMMPKEVLNIISKLNDFNYRAIFRKNTRIATVCVGIIRAYGAIEIDNLMALLRDITKEDDINYMKELIKEVQKYNRVLRCNDNIVYLYSINNYKLLLHDVHLNKEYKEYRVFNESELLSLGEDNWETNSIHAQEFKNRFLKYFIMSDKEVDDLLEVLYDMIQERSLDEALEEVKYMILENEAKDIGKEIIEEYLINIPIWTQKGRSIIEINNGI